MVSIIRVRVLDLDDPLDYYAMMEEVMVISRDVAGELAKLFFGCTDVKGTPVLTQPLTWERLEHLRDTLDKYLDYYSLEYGDVVIQRDDIDYPGAVECDRALYDLKVAAHRQAMQHIFPED